jgi:hypothetical protein
MDGIIGTATTTFETTLGFELGSVVSWMSTQLLLVLGSGIAVLEALLPYIIGLAIIGGIIYFLFRAFRFFRN